MNPQLGILKPTFVSYQGNASASEVCSSNECSSESSDCGDRE